MLEVYDRLDSVLEESRKQQYQVESSLTFLAGDIMEALQITDIAEMEATYKRTFQACHTLHIPLEKTLKKYTVTMEKRS